MKCIVCQKDLKNTEFYCSYGCASKGIKDDIQDLIIAANDLGYLGADEAQKEIDRIEDQEYTRQLEKEKMQSISDFNPSL
jgi:hypothetical protein